MKIDRLFAGESNNPYDKIEFDKRTSVIRNPDGSIVFEMITQQYNVDFLFLSSKTILFHNNFKIKQKYSEKKRGMSIKPVSCIRTSVHNSCATFVEIAKSIN